MEHQTINSKEPNYPVIALTLFSGLFLIAGAAFALCHLIVEPIQEALTPTIGLYAATGVAAVVWMLTGFFITVAIGSFFSKKKTKTPE